MRFTLVSKVLSVVLAGALTACGGTELLDDSADSVETSGSALTALSNSYPHNLKASTGNLYWTTTILNEFGPSSGKILRMSKDGALGSETVIFSESRTSSVVYQGFTFANVGGAWYGYWIACYGAPVCEMRRVPLGGGAAVTLGSVPANPASNLQTDGTSLFWTDLKGVRKMAIGGGATTTLATFPSLISVQSLSLSQTHIYLALETSVGSIAKTGGALTTFATGTKIYNVFAVVGATSTRVYWSDSDARIESKVVGQALGTTLWAGVKGSAVRSLTYDGARMVWSDCDATMCAIRRREANGSITVPFNTLVNATNLQADSTGVFFANSRLYKHSF